MEQWTLTRYLSFWKMAVLGGYLVSVCQCTFGTWKQWPHSPDPHHFPISGKKYETSSSSSTRTLPNLWFSHSEVLFHRSPSSRQRLNTVFYTVCGHLRQHTCLLKFTSRTAKIWFYRNIWYTCMYLYFAKYTFDMIYSYR